MAIIVYNMSKKPLLVQINRGQEIIVKSTANPNVPGNTAVLSAFTNAQEDLVAAQAAFEANRLAAQDLMAQRDSAQAAWQVALLALGGFTQGATGGDASKILSAGFEIRSTATPTAPLSAPVNLQVKTNGMPGVSKLTWNPLGDARSYIVEHSAAPEGPYTQVATPTKANCELDGAEPGKPSWYRVAGVNPDGQGPWSDPAPRPVL